MGGCPICCTAAQGSGGLRAGQGCAGQMSVGSWPYTGRDFACIGGRSARGYRGRRRGGGAAFGNEGPVKWCVTGASAIPPISKRHDRKRYLRASGSGIGG